MHITYIWRFFMIEALFFQCYYAYLEGDLNKTSMLFDFLKEECKLRGKSDSLTQAQLQDLKKVKIALDTGNVPRTVWIDEELAYSGEKDTMVSIRQSDLVEKIHKEAVGSLREWLSKDLYLHNIEHPCPPYGVVDMLYMSSDTAYPLEVKKDKAKHDIIGQIMKYDLHCRFKLHLKFYEKVQPVTVCGAYDGNTLKELKKYGVKTFKYTILENRVKLSQV